MPPPGPVAPRDLRALLWCSIDNDDSRDLDQLSVAERAPDGHIRVRVAIADVDAHATKDSPIDRQAAVNTTSVYTPALVFPMLPLRLSTDLISLNPGEDRLAIVVEMMVAADGALRDTDVYRAIFTNHAKLFVRVFAPPVDGMLAHGEVPGVDVGDRLRVKLERVDIDRGFIDFARS